MIRNFEKETHPLTEAELKIVDILVAGLNTYPKGEEHTKPAGHFMDRLKTINVSVSESRFRKLIQYIRANDLVIGLCSTNRGYFVAKDSKEFKETLLSLYDRIQHQTHTYNCLKRQYNAMGQDAGAKPKNLLD